MLRDVINFIQSRTDLTREAAIREINFAWKELWASDDLPNSLFELTVEPPEGLNVARITLPWYVGEIRGVKMCRERVHLNTPRPYYQDQVYFQSPYIWRVLGKSSLKRTITNATTLDITIPEAEESRFTVTVKGPTDNSQETREQLIFLPGETEKETVNRFTDAYITKDTITRFNVSLTAEEGDEIAFIPNSDFEAMNTVVQIQDKCDTVCNSCRCFDILYKQVAPYLYYDETFVPFAEVLMAKALEWILMPKDGQENRAVLYSNKAAQLATSFNNDTYSVEKKLDLARNMFTTQYNGLI
jgi:hypothetical protein